MGTKVTDLTGIVWDDEVMPEVKKETEKPKGALVPLDRDYNSQEKSYLRSLGTRVGKFQDPKRIELATQALSSGATPATIGALVGGMQREEVAYKKDQALTLDRKKVSQNIVKGWADLETVGKHLSSLVDNYDDSNIGYIDSSSPVQWASRQFGTGDEGKRDAQDTSISAIETSLKKIAGYGANYSDKEQELMRKFMPSVRDGEQAYKNQVYNSALNLKRDLASRINTQDLAGYESDDLKKMLGTIDTLINKTKHFKNGTTAKTESKETEPNNAPIGLKSLSTPATLTRAEKLKILRGE